jgi:hypothetical protein
MDTFTRRDDIDPGSEGPALRVPSRVAKPRLDECLGGSGALRLRSPVTRRRKRMQIGA